MLDNPVESDTDLTCVFGPDQGAAKAVIEDVLQNFHIGTTRRWLIRESRSVPGELILVEGIKTDLPRRQMGFNKNGILILEIPAALTLNGWVQTARMTQEQRIALQKDAIHFFQHSTSEQQIQSLIKFINKRSSISFEQMMSEQIFPKDVSQAATFEYFKNYIYRGTPTGIATPSGVDHPLAAATPYRFALTPDAQNATKEESDEVSAALTIGGHDSSTYMPYFDSATATTPSNANPEQTQVEGVLERLGLNFWGF